jgi:hypothetical protein
MGVDQRDPGGGQIGARLKEIDVGPRARPDERLRLLQVLLQVRSGLFRDGHQRLVGARAEEGRAHGQIELLRARVLRLCGGLRGGLLRSPALAGLPEVVEQLIDGDAAGEEVVSRGVRAASARRDIGDRRARPGDEVRGSTLVRGRRGYLWKERRPRFVGDGAGRVRARVRLAQLRLMRARSLDRAVEGEDLRRCGESEDG